MYKQPSPIKCEYKIGLKCWEGGFFGMMEIILNLYTIHIQIRIKLIYSLVDIGWNVEMPLGKILLEFESVNVHYNGNSNHNNLHTIWVTYVITMLKINERYFIYILNFTLSCHFLFSSSHVIEMWKWNFFDMNYKYTYGKVFNWNKLKLINLLNLKF